MFTLVNEDHDIPYELSSVCRFASPKQDRNSYHLLKDARILPCGHIACLDCIINAIKRNGNYIECNFSKADHRKECTKRHEMTLKDADQLRVNNEYKTVLEVNFIEIGNFIKDNLRTYINKACNNNLHDLGHIQEYHSEELEIRKESLKCFYDNLTEKAQNNTTELIESRNITTLQNIQQILKIIVLDIQSKNIGRITQIFHESIKNRMNNPKIIQFRSHMRTTRGMIETGFNGEMAIYGENRTEQKNALQNENLVIKSFKNFIFTNKEINRINYEQANGEVIENYLNTLVKLCSDKRENIYVLLRNKILVCDISLSICKIIIEIRRGPNPIDIYYNDRKLYVLRQQQAAIEVYSLENPAVQTLNLKDEDEDELDNVKSILITQNILIAFSNNKNIYLYDYDDINESIHLRNNRIPTQREVIMCIAENCLFTIDTDSQLACYELKKQGNNIQYEKLYEQRVFYTGKQMSSMLFMDECLMVLSEEEDIVVLI